MNFKLPFSLSGIQAIHLKKNIFSSIIKASIIGSIIMLAIAVIVRKHIYAIIGYGLLFVFYLLQYLLLRKYTDEEKHGSIYFLYLLIQNCVLFPALYITGGGIDSGISLLYVFGGVTTILLLDGIYLIIVSVIFAACASIAYMVDYNNPGYTDLFTVLGDLTYMEIGLTTIAVGLGIGFFLRILTDGFEKNQEKAQKLLHQIEDSSARDPLTGAYNRRYLMQYLDQCMSKVQSGELRAFSILMFDIDHFKKINDTYGHLAGDDCIKNLSYILKNSLRNVDVVARYGGEEFICVLPTAEDTPAFRRAEQIREHVELTQLSDEIQKKITVSGGVAMYKPGMTAEQLISEADENLYLAKEGGRNQIVWHKGGIPPLCYVAYDTTVLEPVHNAGRRFSDATADIDIKKV